jgi:RNA polymerase sigma-70 factor, ECF subfamily
MSESIKILIVDATMSEATAATKQKVGFDEAFTLHHRTVFRCARAVVSDQGLAEDITQEVFMRLYNNLDAIVNEEMLKPWLIRVTINLAKNAIRGNIRANVREENYFKESEENAIFEPEIEYEKRVEAQAVRRTLEKIKEPLRSCLVLKQQGLSYKEIAETLDLNEGSIGQFVARARKEFVRFYGKIGRETL